MIEICEKMNELQEYLLGMNAPKLKVPDQGAIDERMPLKYLRPVVDLLKAIIMTRELQVKPPVQLTDNMDYHFFVPWVRSIAECIDAVIRELGGE